MHISQIKSVHVATISCNRARQFNQYFIFINNFLNALHMCEDVSCMHDYKYLEIHILNIQFENI